jgi:hypothetical protein
MWIFLNNAFLSIVADRNSERLLVRARLKGDIERTFPGSAVVEETGADYRFRTWLDRKTVADVLPHKVEEINYPNFKGSVQDHARHQVYMSVWNVMHTAQERARRQPVGKSS